MRSTVFAVVLGSMVGWSLGCAPHVARLADDRIAGVAATYAGSTPPVRLSAARRLMALADAEDAAQQQLVALEEQIRSLLAEPTLNLELLQGLRDLHDRVSARLRELRGALVAAPASAGFGLAHGTVVNRRGEPRLVSIFDGSGARAVEPFILEPGASRELDLEPGEAYRFEYVPLGPGVTFVRWQSRPLQEGEPWLAGVY